MSGFFVPPFIHNSFEQFRVIVFFFFLITLSSRKFRVFGFIDDQISRLFRMRIKLQRYKCGKKHVYNFASLVFPVCIPV